MTEDEFRKAEKIRQEIDKINDELSIWDEYLVSADRLAYSFFVDGYGGSERLRGFENTIPDKDFQWFRASMMQRLKVRRAELEAQFLAI